MKAIFLQFLNINMAASWLILAVFIVRFILKKFPKSMTYMIYGIIGLRLSLPYFFHSRFSYIPSIERISEGIFRFQHLQDESLNGINTSLQFLQENSLYTSISTFYNEYWFVLVNIWIIGIIVFSVYGIYSYIQLKNRLDISILMKDQVYACDSIFSPFILGIIHPKIYIPVDSDPTCLEAILLHEQSHIKRKDPLWKAIAYVLRTIYWFNPLVWIAYYLFERDMEMGCDEIVIMDMKIEDKREYCKILLAMSTNRHSNDLHMPLAFGEVAVKQRIKNVAIHEKMSLVQPSIFLTFCIFLSLISFSQPLDFNDIIRIHTSNGMNEINIYELNYKDKMRLFNSEDGFYYKSGDMINFSEVLYDKLKKGKDYYFISTLNFIGENGKMLSVSRNEIKNNNLYLIKENGYVNFLYYDHEALRINDIVEKLIEIKVTYYN